MWCGVGALYSADQNYSSPHSRKKISRRCSSSERKCLFTHSGLICENMRRISARSTVLYPLLPFTYSLARLIRPTLSRRVANAVCLQMGGNDGRREGEGRGKGEGRGEGEGNLTGSRRGEERREGRSETDDLRDGHSRPRARSIGRREGGRELGGVTELAWSVAVSAAAVRPSVRGRRKFSSSFVVC